MSTPEEIEAVAPLDAYATAKPDEPTFTLQGGDPLAAPLVRIWVEAARVRAGLGDSVLGAASALLKVAREHVVGDDDKEVKSLKLRATAAEEVSWTMDAYRRDEHHIDTDLPSTAGETHLEELARIQLHDLRIKVAQRLSNFSSEMADLLEAMLKMEAPPAVTSNMRDLGLKLGALSELIEPRRIFKKKG